MTRSLLPKPLLENLRKQAKRLQKAWQAGDEVTLGRIRATHPQYADASDDALRAAKPRLTDCQLILAREAGFDSWPAMKVAYSPESKSGAKVLRHRPFVKEIQYYSDRAAGLRSVHKTGQRRALELIRRSHPRLAAASDDAIREAKISQEDAELICAREHGFLDWTSFSSHIESPDQG